MNNSFTKLILVVALILTCNFFRVSAQVTPTTTDVSLFCEGSAMTLQLPATANVTWILRFSAAQGAAATPVTMTNGAISVADTKTGYYYLSSKSNDPNSCESDMQEIPVYVLKPLVPAFTAVNFCIESPAAQVGTVANPESANITSLVYQWYTVGANNTETAIAGATNISYTPSNPAVGTTKYRLKAGYEIGGKKYCPQIAEHDVTVTAKPTKPTITPAQISGTAGAVTF